MDGYGAGQGGGDEADHGQQQPGVGGGHLRLLGLNNDPEPVHGHRHDGEGGHEGGYAGEGLNQSGKYKFYFQVDKLSLRAIYNY